MGGQVSVLLPGKVGAVLPVLRSMKELKEHQLVNFEKTCLHFTHGQARTHKSMSKQSDV